MTLEFYKSIGAALFPISAGKKEPFGIVKSFKQEASTDFANLWPGHTGNWGVYAAGSRLIIVDVDTKLGRDAAWALWHELCQSWGMAGAVAPHVQTASGGWHIYFKVPEGIDPLTLRQPDAVKQHINVRVIGYTVAAGSHWDGTKNGEQVAEGGPYQFFPNVTAPYDCPAALLELCSRKAVTTATVAKVGDRNSADVGALLDWMHDREQFESYEDWLHVGMALKLEFGDAGFDLWAQTFNSDPTTPDNARGKWSSFGESADANSVTLATFLNRAHKLGWSGQVRKTVSGMFGDVAQVAIAAAAAAPVGAPQSTTSMLFSGQAELTKIGEVILRNFLSDTGDAPTNPRTADIPQLPEEMKDHGLFTSVNAAIRRVFALAEARGFKPARINRAMGVVHQVNRSVAEQVIARLQTLGVAVQESKIGSASLAIEQEVQRGTSSFKDFQRDEKGKPESDNPDNIRFFLDMIALEVRWNAWLDQMEVRGGECATPLFYDKWTRVDDTTMSMLLARAKRTGTRFMASKDFWFEQLPAIAKENTVDPVLNKLSTLEKAWDGTARLDTWLTTYAGVPDSAYTRAAARSLIGGMVQRVRRPGCKLDTLVVFHGPQGTGKSTMASIFAMRSGWFSDSIVLGMDAKELLIALRGKTVAEVAEMDMRSTATVKSVKAMLSKTFDEAREPYGRATTQRPRRNIFIGTTNEDRFLNDPTGGRRFLPIKILIAVLITELLRDIDQLIAEACVQESQGVDFNIPPSVWGDAAEMQEGVRSESAIEITVAHAIGEKDGIDGYIHGADLIDFINLKRLRVHYGVLSDVMLKLGFRNEQRMINGARARSWVRGAWTKDLPRWRMEGDVLKLKGGSATVHMFKNAI